jgi:hypothetical protein
LTMVNVKWLGTKPFLTRTLLAQCMSSAFNGVSVDGIPVKGYQQKVSVHYWSLHF